jgi:hypothetical protein
VTLRRKLPAMQLRQRLVSLATGSALGVVAGASCGTLLHSIEPSMPSDAYGLRVSGEAMGMILGIVAIVGPAFYFVGRFHQRLTVLEKQTETLIAEAVAIGRGLLETLGRIASHAAEACPMGDACPYRHDRHVHHHRNPEDER